MNGRLGKPEFVMFYPQVLVYERDGSLGRLLRPLAKSRAWSFHELRRRQPCRSLLKHGNPTVVTLTIGRDVASELELLQEIYASRCNAAAVAVADVDDPLLTSLSWDLGASFVMTPQQPRQQLPEIVAALMASIIARQQPALAAKLHGSHPAPSSEKKHGAQHA